MATTAPTIVKAESHAHVWGPFAATAVAAGLGYGLATGSGPAALGIAVGVLLVPALVLGLAQFLGRPLYGIDRPEEVGYITALLVALAGWTAAVGLPSWSLAAGTAAAVAGGSVWWLAYGPGQRAMMLADFLGASVGLIALAALNPLTTDPPPWRWAVAAVAGTALAAVPYWLHRRDKAETESTLDLAPLIAMIEKHLRTPVQVVPDSLNIGAHGRYGIRLRLSNGKTASDVVAVLVRVESELGLREGAIVAAGQRSRRNEVTVTVTPTELRTSDLDRPPLPTSITQPAALGQYDSGEPMRVSVYDQDGARGAVIGGQKGSGKSRALWTLMEAWTHADDVLFFMGDLSGGATSEPWLPCLYRRELDTARLKKLIIALDAAATARAATLPGRGWESWQPSPENPAIVVPIDECQKLLKNDWEAQKAVEHLVQVDRKSGISVVLMCPNPVQMEGISPTIREQARIRLCFRSPGSAVRWVLGGTRAEPMSYAVREFDTPGQVLGDGPGMEPVPGHTLDTPLAHAKGSALRHAARRPALDALTAAALSKATGEDYTRPQGALMDDDDEQGERWTDEDDAAVADETDDGLRATLSEMARSDTALGKALPPLPKAPRERLTTEAAISVAATMVGQPGGTTPALVMVATGRSRSWVQDRLAAWVKQGAAIQPTTGVYMAAGAAVDQ